MNNLHSMNSLVTTEEWYKLELDILCSGAITRLRKLTVLSSAQRTFLGGLVEILMGSLWGLMWGTCSLIRILMCWFCIYMMSWNKTWDQVIFITMMKTTINTLVTIASYMTMILKSLWQYSFSLDILSKPVIRRSVLDDQIMWQCSMTVHCTLAYIL